MVAPYSISSTPRRTCCEVCVMLCMTQYICAPLQSAGGFILIQKLKVLTHLCNRMNKPLRIFPTQAWILSLIHI